MPCVLHPIKKLGSCFTRSQNRIRDDEYKKKREKEHDENVGLMSLWNGAENPVLEYVADSSLYLYFSIGYFMISLVHQNLEAL